ncbi:hypothetical protein O7631_09970 [Micromonospora sp. WMMD967]|uniref:hypothetical protein n=1 Tax=Micromonospora sp. WMMD967 TaxID=3016101 RepID=UPI002417C6A6|nr:hypothetical protein [Micromonospora sp. WMMD967]MDG4836842.1 hypothetical protein [Micromonospora sp. WMMD967]
MVRSGSKSTWSTLWAWPVGIAIGLAIGIPVFGAKGGVAFGVAFSLAFAVGLDLLRGRKSSVEAAPGGSPAQGDQRDDPAQGATDGSATSVAADGPYRP